MTSYHIGHALKKTLIVISIEVSLLTALYADSPPNIPFNIPWVDTGGSSTKGKALYAGVTDIAAAFNNARRLEEVQLGLAVNSISDLVLPSQTVWNAMSDNAKTLFILNNERISRVNVLTGVLGLPFAGIESSIDLIATNYANLLQNMGTYGHYQPSGDSALDGPMKRIEQDLMIGSKHSSDIHYRLGRASTHTDNSLHIYGDSYKKNAACHEFIVRNENLAFFEISSSRYTGASSILLPIERSIYNWIYTDASSNWRNRETVLLQDKTLGQVGDSGGMTNDNGSENHEGFIGIHKIGTITDESLSVIPTGFGPREKVSAAQELSEFYRVTIVLNLFDPVSDSSSLLRGCTYNVTLKTEDLPKADINRLPVANNDVVSTDYETSSKTIKVLTNDSDPDNDQLIVTTYSSPSNGKVVQNGNTFVYTPNISFNGSDSFAYSISDGFGGRATAIVSVEVKENKSLTTTLNDEVLDMTTEPEKTTSTVEVDTAEATSSNSSDTVPSSNTGTITTEISGIVAPDNTGIVSSNNSGAIVPDNTGTVISNNSGTLIPDNTGTVISNGTFSGTTIFGNVTINNNIPAATPTISVANNISANVVGDGIDKAISNSAIGSNSTPVQNPDSTSGSSNPPVKNPNSSSGSSNTVKNPNTTSEPSDFPFDVTVSVSTVENPDSTSGSSNLSVTNLNSTSVPNIPSTRNPNTASGSSNTPVKNPGSTSGSNNSLVKNPNITSEPSDFPFDVTVSVSTVENPDSTSGSNNPSVTNLDSTSGVSNIPVKNPNTTSGSSNIPVKNSSTTSEPSDLPFDITVSVSTIENPDSTSGSSTPPVKNSNSTTGANSSPTKSSTSISGLNTDSSSNVSTEKPLALALTNDQSASTLSRTDGSGGSFSIIILSYLLGLGLFRRKIKFLIVCVLGGK